MVNQKKNVAVFDRDAELGGYVYTDQSRLSSRLANQRMSEAILDFYPFSGRTVLDLGCGGGSYSIGLATAGAREVLGVDPADQAIEKAKLKSEALRLPNLKFCSGNIYELPEKIKQAIFDVVVLRGVLHHLPEPEDAVRVALSVGRSVVIVEPNGLNPVLKILEKVSSYHIEHEEQSFLPATIDKWCRRAGGSIARRQFINLVPMFCPSAVAPILSVMSGAVEKIPGIRAVACGQYVVRADRV